LENDAENDVEYSKYLTIELNLPKEPMVIKYQGPNKDWDDFMTFYDPSNGLVSSGDIYQFVGWK
jgi:hypothetical protein